jgi:hypothetical protein
MVEHLPFNVKGFPILFEKPIINNYKTLQNYEKSQIIKMSLP